MIVDFLEERFRRDVKRLHLLGPRVLFELLAEIGCDRLIRTKIERLISRYAGIDPTALAATGDDLLPPSTPAAADYLDQAIKGLSDIQHLVNAEVILGELALVGINLPNAEAALRAVRAADCRLRRPRRRRRSSSQS
jgi:hypothetical protein